MGELTFGGGNENLVGQGSTRVVFLGGGNEQIFSWWEGPAPILSSRKTNIYIYHSASLCTDPPSKPQPAIFSVPQGTKNLNKLPLAHKKP